MAIQQKAAVADVIPLTKDRTDRPLRYQPVDRGFEIENGPYSFNRPLYGGYTAFRVDAGDKPEFSLYLPGRGGVGRVGVATASGAFWLRDAKSIKARYADGAMQYQISDPALGATIVQVDIVATRDREGVIVRATALGDGLNIVFAYGGMNGDKSSRDGDIGTEKLPVSQHFALKAEHCKDNVIDLQPGAFTLKGKPGMMEGFAPGAKLDTVDANQWANADALVKSAHQPTERPAVMAYVSVGAKQSCYFGLFRADKVAATQPTKPQEVADAFDRAADQNRTVARRVTVDTPDPFINSAAGALCLAADALWDQASGSIMHGGVGGVDRTSAGVGRTAPTRPAGTTAHARTSRATSPSKTPRPLASRPGPMRKKTSPAARACCIPMAI